MKKSENNKASEILQSFGSQAASAQSQKIINRLLINPVRKNILIEEVTMNGDTREGIEAIILLLQKEGILSIIDSDGMDWCALTEKAEYALV